jgi:hypothetical protein
MKTDNSLSDHEIFPDSSFSTQASYQPPWSPVDQSRVPGIHVTAQHIDFESPSTFPISRDAYRHSYENSVLSMDSSPQARGVGTPTSEMSPLLSPAHLSSSMGSTNSHMCQGHDHHHETPRAIQTRFQQTQTLNLDVIGIGMGSQSQGNKRRRSQAPREPTHSPVSDYVMVESVDMSVSPSYSGSMKAEPSNSAPISPMTFVTEQYPLSSDSGKQPSTQGVIRKIRDSKGKRAGGRSLGSHLPADKAARAKQLREEGSCWICCLQRDSVCYEYF